VATRKPRITKCYPKKYKKEKTNTFPKTEKTGPNESKTEGTKPRTDPLLIGLKKRKKQ